MINGNNMYIQTAGMNIRKDNDDWRRAVDTVDAAETAILTEKTITENGTYTAAEDNADGYSSVTVDVSGGVGFAKMDVYAWFYESGAYENERMLFINNTESSIDVSEIAGSYSILIINPIDELKVKPLSSYSSAYSVSFIPTATCKVYEDETELDLNEIFQSVDTPVGPTQYTPDGSKIHVIHGNYSPYDGRVRKLFDTQQKGFELTIE
jgi:hypothetical protein